MRREWNIQVKHDKLIGQTGVYMDAENVHVTELGPGEIVVSRKQVRDAVFYASPCAYMSGEKETSGLVIKMEKLLDALFGPEPQDGE